MKNLRLLVAFAALILAFTGCKKDEEFPSVMTLGPIASFSYSGGECGAPCPVVFSNSSSNSTSYTWDFGDGSPVSTAATATVKHVYDSVGTYLVKLTAHGADNSSSSKIMAVEVSGPKADFDVFPYSQTGGDPYSIQFYNRSQFASTFIWDFGDGSGPVNDSTLTSNYYNYSKGGTYTLTLTAKNLTGQSHTISKDVVIEPILPLEYLTARPFKLTDFSVIYNSQNYNLYTELDQCGRDDLYKFDFGNIITRTDAGVSCGGQLTQTGYWQFGPGGYSTLYLPSFMSVFSGNGTYEIVELTPDKLVISRTDYFWLNSFSGYGTGLLTYTAQ